MGRLFTAADDQEGAPGALILSDGLWRRAFGGDRSVLGTHVTLDDGVYTIVGVMPAHFSFPTRDEEMWLPARLPARGVRGSQRQPSRSGRPAQARRDDRQRER